MEVGGVLFKKKKKNGVYGNSVDLVGSRRIKKKKEETEFCSNRVDAVVGSLVQLCHRSALTTVDECSVQIERAHLVHSVEWFDDRALPPGRLARCLGSWATRRSFVCMLFLCPMLDLRLVFGLPSGGLFFFFQAEDGIRDHCVTGVQTCALPISSLAQRGGHGRDCEGAVFF